ncbi:MULTISPECIES: hypothetical protein [Chromobacterium]|uniref:Uncharacterized protein n=1 Tax=Chromobacterium aquaticum TaxID=467180 RepID=A0ABV8ZTK6_9NEIS|nr:MULTISPECIES: hypothetical protein [Chromobacterium]KMN32286.1 hypothetical protein VI26_17870 [Chromobacterium sp. LK1]MCD5362584.1 hypothetical protein [Chromobacterium aquaticum]
MTFEPLRPRLTDHGSCIAVESLRLLKPLPSVKAMLHTPRGVLPRKVCAVCIHHQRLWADRHTGSLYCAETGYSLRYTSLRLYIAPQPHEA